MLISYHSTEKFHRIIMLYCNACKVNEQDTFQHEL